MSDTRVAVEPRISLTLHYPMTAFDRKLGSLTTIQAGEHTVERVPNPFGNNTPWLVILGTDIGASEAYWQDFSQQTFSHPAQVSIHETTP